MPQISSEYATTLIVKGPTHSRPTPVPPLQERRRTIPRKGLVLTIFLAVISVAAIVPGVIAFVNRPSRTTALFIGTGAGTTNRVLLVRVYNSGRLPSVVEPRARLQVGAAGLAAATLKIVNVNQIEIPGNGKADLKLDLESVWISAGSTNETVAGELCKASGTLQVFVKERDRWGALRPAGEPLTIELTGRQIRDALLQGMGVEAPAGCS